MDWLEVNSWFILLGLLAVIEIHLSFLIGGSVPDTFSDSVLRVAFYSSGDIHTCLLQF